MSDSTRFTCDYAKRKANCKKCKQPIDKGLPRIAKCAPNFFNDGDGEMKNYHHIACMFEAFSRARATTKKIEDPSDLEGFSDMQDPEKDQIRKLIQELLQKQAAKASTSKTSKASKTTPKKQPAKSPVKAKVKTSLVANAVPATEKTKEASPKKRDVPASKDNNFREFRRICALIAEESSYNEKSNIVKNFVTKGTSGSGYTGDLYVFIKLLLPGSVKRIYNIQSKTIVKIFSKIFSTDLDKMMEDLEQGDVSETVFKFFEQSDDFPPCKKSSLTIHDVDRTLDKLQGLTREEDQEIVLAGIAKRSTANDLKAIIRLIKGDLRITAGPKHILDALDPNAHEAFKASRNLEDVIDRIEERKKSGSTSALEVRASLMTPVAPMLAEACKSVEQAMKKCPNGMYSEIKYDGERVQLHMQGGKFQFYSRSLKPVLKHKVAHFDDYIPKAFPDGHSMILDSEVLLVDNETGVPLPFGTLGVHKKAKFESASVCLFIFDILHFNGENLMQKPICERRQILSKNIREIKNRVLLSEMKFVNKPDELKEMIVRVIKDGLEGLVLKDTKSIYEPGKRHWLKVKKDYLMQGAMADTADLVVLGAFFGTGNKGGLMSVFLMGVHDPKTDTWRTVTKVGNGHDDDALDRVNKQLKVVKISKDFKRVPSWLSLNRQHVPDFVVEDPKKAPVWEITGTEFSKSSSHTADGISIRFPRVTKIRKDKDWKTATDLPRLRLLFEKSKEESDVSALFDVKPSPSKESPRKRKIADSSPVKALKKVKSEITKPDFLRDVFTGMKVYVSSTVSKLDKLKRYLIAYDADVLEEFHMSSATHAIFHKDDDLADEKFVDLPKNATKWTEMEAWNRITSSAS